MFGAWGPATASTGKTMQLRALDWDIDGPFKDYSAGVCGAAAVPTTWRVAAPGRPSPQRHVSLVPAVIVYHPAENAGLGHAFANVGFIGWIGALTGQSSAQLAISEIGAPLPPPAPPPVRASPS